MRHLRRRYGRATRAQVKRYQVSKHSLDRQGYDKRGRYYGAGQALWDVWDSTGDEYYEVRASSAREAREKVIADPSTWRYRR